MKNNDVKLSDFGISKFILTQITEFTINTELYDAPEIIKKQESDFKSDIW